MIHPFVFGMVLGLLVAILLVGIATLAVVLERRGAK